MKLTWIGPPPTKAEQRAIAAGIRSGKIRSGAVLRRGKKSLRAARAAAEYTKFHWGERPSKRVRVKLPSYDAGIYELGKLRAVEYEASKGGERAIWVHKFTRPYPSLTATPGGVLGPIVGGAAVVTKRGIER
ncbi:MAG TPA: hypothetical protein VN896_07920 [Methylomirabilota bacterium]|nr:hypothetical protein [Methylomirabilota bacterium]